MHNIDEQKNALHTALLSSTSFFYFKTYWAQALCIDRLYLCQCRDHTKIFKTCRMI